VIHWRLQSEAERDAARARLEERENLLQRRERAYRRLARESEVIFRESRDPIFFVDVDRDETGAYRFEFLRLSVSHEDLTGMVSQDVRGKSPREVLGEKVGAEVAENYRRCAEARGPIEYEEELPAPSGTKVWHTKLSPVIVDGKVTEIVGVAREITDQRRRER
jgi:PAS domain S-box-containing protein